MGFDLTVPNWWEALLVTLAAYRSWHLIVDDSILDRPRRWLLRLGDWQEEDGVVNLPVGYRTRVAEFFNCVWCFGFWNGVAWWVLWLLWPTFALFLAFPFAASTVVSLVKINLDPEE